MKILYSYYDWQLTEDGKCFKDGTEVEWYKKENGKPWIPAKRKNFVGLVKQMERDGDLKFKEVKK